MNVLKMLTSFNMVSAFARILLAMLLGGCIGLEREKNKRPAGFRTHILVCVGSCMTSLIGLYVCYEMGDVSDPLRISAQVISGIGFLGVGTIMVKEHDRITGLTTAAGLWTTAAIGIACGYGFYMGALVGTFIVTLTAAVLFKFEARGRRKNRKSILYAEVKGTERLNEYIDWLMQEMKAKNVMVVAPRTAMSGNVGLEIVLPMVAQEDMTKILQVIREKEAVIFAMESIKEK